MKIKPPLPASLDNIVAEKGEEQVRNDLEKLVGQWKCIECENVLPTGKSKCPTCNPEISHMTNLKREIPDESTVWVRCVGEDDFRPIEVDWSRTTIKGTCVTADVDGSCRPTRLFNGDLLLTGKTGKFRPSTLYVDKSEVVDLLEGLCTLYPHLLTKKETESKCNTCGGPLTGKAVTCLHCSK